MGEPAITASKRVGSNGYVLATDISPQMLSIAKQRSHSLGLENTIEFKEADAETIDLPASSFNAVLCRWGLMYLPNPTGALSTIHRTLVPDGYVAAAVWGTPDNVHFLAPPISVVRQETHAQLQLLELLGPLVLLTKIYWETPSYKQDSKMYTQNILMQYLNLIQQKSLPDINKQ